VGGFKLECVSDRETSPLTIESQEFRPPRLSGSTVVAATYSGGLFNVQIRVLGPSLEGWGCHSVAVGAVNAGGTPFPMGLVRVHTTLERSLCYQAHSTGSHSHDRAR
jgi:hypothetical protein